MAKKPIITFTKTDAPVPKKLPTGLIGLRTPYPITLKPGVSKDLDLVMSCNVMLVYDKGAFEPGHNIVVKLSNTTSEDVIYETGDVVTRVFPLITVDFDIE